MGCETFRHWLLQFVLRPRLDVARCGYPIYLGVPLKPALSSVVHSGTEAAHIVGLLFTKEEVMLSDTLPAHHLLLSRVDIR